jgi:hypothetical protein
MPVQSATKIGAKSRTKLASHPDSNCPKRAPKIQAAKCVVFVLDAALDPAKRNDSSKYELPEHRATCVAESCGKALDSRGSDFWVRVHRRCSGAVI